MKLTYIVTIATSLLVGTFAYADDMTIEMLNKREDGAKMVYSEDIANIDVGDTITWVPTSKGHNVQFIAGPEGWDLPKKSKNNKEVSLGLNNSKTNSVDDAIKRLREVKSLLEEGLITQEEFDKISKKLKAIILD